jgi:hypothetical protein
LLADRAGTSFAGVATRSEASARALQARLDAGFHLDDFFPRADGLPEGIQDAEFQRRYGGVGGDGYRRLESEIERRVADCPAYRARQGVGQKMAFAERFRSALFPAPGHLSSTEERESLALTRLRSYREDPPEAHHG